MSKYTNNTKLTIEAMKQQGFTSRAIAAKVGISKSGVNDYLSKSKGISTGFGPRILFLDFETSAALVYAFGRFKINVGQDNVKEEGGKLLCAGLAINQNPVTVVAVDPAAPLDDFHVCKFVYELFTQVDIVVAHNGRNFDLKMLNARLAYYGFPPISGVKIIDTLEMAKTKFRFPSNRLDALGEYLGLGRKQSNDGIKLWKNVQEGDAEALQTMIEYCARDVELLRDVFYALMAYGGSSAVNWAMYYNDDKQRCIYCGVDDVEPTGKHVYTALSKFNEYRCKCCGSTMRDRSNKNSRQKQQTLFTRIV